MCAHCVAEKFISGLPLGAHCGVCAKDLLGWTVRATRATRAAPARRVDLPLPASCVRPPGLSWPQYTNERIVSVAHKFDLVCDDGSRTPKMGGHSPKLLSVRAKGVFKDAKTGETVAQIQCAGCKAPPEGAVIRIQ
jgi:hypothetical protein